MVIYYLQFFQFFVHPNGGLTLVLIFHLIRQDSQPRHIPAQSLDSITGPGRELELAKANVLPRLLEPLQQAAKLHDCGVKAALKDGSLRLRRCPHRIGATWALASVARVSTAVAVATTISARRVASYNCAPRDSRTPHSSAS